MSTLRCTNLQDTSGANSSTTAQIASGRAKAWVNFNGTGVVAIRSQFNVNSITDNGTGNYTVNLTSSLSDANYAVVGMSGGHGTSPSNGHRSIMMGSDMTSSSCRVIPGYTGAPTSGNDDPVVCVAFFR